MLVFCQECEKATGTGYFSGKPQHDRFVKSPWNTHQLEEREPATDKASWILLCPVCKDEAATLIPDAGWKVKHPTVGTDENGDELVRCTACGRLYRFNLQWTFEKKELPPKVKERAVRDRVFVIRPSQGSEEIEVYATPDAADERIKELEDEALETAGYRKIDDETWESPYGEQLDCARAVEQAEEENAADMPAQPEEVYVLD